MSSVKKHSKLANSNASTITGSGSKMTPVSLECKTTSIRNDGSGSRMTHKVSKMVETSAFDDCFRGIE